MPHCVMRDEIVLLVRDGDDYFDFGRMSRSHLDNVIPVIGDTLTEHITEMGVGMCRVVDRFLADFRSEEGEHDDLTCWVLVVEQPDDCEDHFFGLDKVLQRIREENFSMVFTPNHITIEAAEALDYASRDPAYWTPERKRRLQKEREARLAAIRAEEATKPKD